MSELDKVVKAIAELSYPDLRLLASSLSDVLDEVPTLSEDALVPVLYDWANSWQPDDSDPAP